MTEGKILVAEEAGVYLLKLIGDVRITLSTSLGSYIDAIFKSDHVDSVFIDLVDTDAVDSTALGLLTKLAMHCAKKFGIQPTVFCTSPSIYRILESMGLEDVFVIVRGTPTEIENLRELQQITADVDELRHQVLEAHRLLSILNSKNRREFLDLIRTLEEEQAESDRESVSQ